MMKTGSPVKFEKIKTIIVRNIRIADESFV